MKSEHSKSKWWPVVAHAFRTAVVAVASYMVARLLRLPEAYWAPVTSIVITQSSLGAALTVSGQRFVGTAIGSAAGAVVLTRLPATTLVFGICVFLLGVITAAIHADRSAYRFAGVSLGIVMLVPKMEPAWVIAFHRFAEVSVGIGMALVSALIWPEQGEGSVRRSGTPKN